MEKRVRYNGGTMSYYGCTEPTELVEGKIYRVISESVSNWQTNYTLAGIEGHFNSVWFDIVEEEIPVYMAVGNKLPVVGERYYIRNIIEVDGNKMRLGPWNTSTVKEIRTISKNIFCVNTANSIYIVQVSI